MRSVRRIRRTRTVHISNRPEGDLDFGPPTPETLSGWKREAQESLRLFEDLGPLVGHLAPDLVQEVVLRAGRAADEDSRYALLKQLHTTIANLEPDRLRLAVQGSRFHRDLSEQLLGLRPGDPDVIRNDRAAFHHPEEAAEFRKSYVRLRPDNTGMRIRDPESAKDAGIRDSGIHSAPDGDYFTVFVHGDPDRVFFGDRHLAARDLANLLRHTPEWADAGFRRPIRLISCETGEKDEGFAQQLADDLGVEVKAPNTAAWASPNGPAYASAVVVGPDGTVRLPLAATGAFRIFSPAGRTPDGTLLRRPVRLDTEYPYLGRGPALTVLGRAVAGPLGDELLRQASRRGVKDRTALRAAVAEWRELTGRPDGRSETTFRLAETARDNLDKVLTTETIAWMIGIVEPGTEVTHALDALSASREFALLGVGDPQPPGSQPERPRPERGTHASKPGHGRPERGRPRPATCAVSPRTPPRAMPSTPNTSAISRRAWPPTTSPTG
ncbi:hypothetical protein ACFQ9X_00935 [Catenulispora yoronensis]